MEDFKQIIAGGVVFKKTISDIEAGTDAIHKRSMGLLNQFVEQGAIKMLLLIMLYL